MDAMNYVMGLDFLGHYSKETTPTIFGAASADKAYTDKSTVKKVQKQLHALSVATKNPALDPYHGKYADDGVLGSGTKTAIAAFNTKYAYPTDGGNITDAMISILYNQQLTDAAKGGADAIAKLADSQAETAQVQAAAAEERLASAPPAAVPAAQQQVAIAQNLVKVAQEQQVMAKEITASVNPNFFTKEIASGVPMWMGLAAATIVAGGIALLLTSKSAPSSRMGFSR